MYFSSDDLEKLQTEHSAVAGKCQRLVLSYITRNYKDSRAREHAKYGLSRRLRMLVWCIDNVFELLPPNLVKPPRSDVVLDATINIQAYVFNMFGSIDNLAWIWVKENGLSIADRRVGLLSKNNKDVRSSFSTESQKYLSGLNDWFDHLKDFRDALAHRIPLFIPPYGVPNGKEAVYQQLHTRITEALKRSDSVEAERLSAEQAALVTFAPYMTHSIEEKAKVIKFHPQLLTDFLTIEELAQKMLRELDS